MVVVLVNYNNTDSNNHKKIKSNMHVVCVVYLHPNLPALWKNSCLGGEEININA